jgi:Fe-S cluster assembly protein SufD
LADPPAPAAPGREAEEAAGGGSEPDWLSERRRAAAASARELELPGPKTKGWEFTDLSSLDLEAYVPAEGGDPAAAARTSPLLASPEGAVALTQVDAASLNGAAISEDTTDPIVIPLSEAAVRYPEIVRERLGSLAPGRDPFVAINEAGWRGGAFVYVPSGARLESPISLRAIHEAAGTAVEWRTLVVLEENSEAEVWEQYLSADAETDALFNAVVELFVGPGATLRYVSGQALSERSWIFGTQRAEVARDASLEWVALGFGSARGKVRMDTRLAGEGSSAKVTGAYAGLGSQHLDFDTTQEHAAPHTTSDLAFRGVLAGRATAVWSGMIRVDPGAQQTDAFQESRNLLLSTKAHADAIPGLEIEANDVRCTHAAAVAQVDREQLHYLRAHGLRAEVATRLIVEGFLGALAERVAEGPVRDAVARALERRLGELLAGG